MAGGQITFQFPGVIPSVTTLQDSNLNVRIAGLTIVNQSNCVCGIFLGRSASGTPDLQVLPSSMAGFPINNTNLIDLSWVPPGGTVPQGSAYAHYTDQIIIATANQILSSLAEGGVWDASLWDAALWTS